MKGVQCYELFGGISLKIHTFSFFIKNDVRSNGDDYGDNRIETMLMLMTIILKINMIRMMMLRNEKKT